MLDIRAAAPNRWDLYRVLSEPVRLRLLALCAEEELAIGELAELLDESQPNVSRHVAPLRQAGLLAVRREGTRTLLKLADRADTDAVIADALVSGRALCEADRSLARIADVVRARDALGREFFAKGGSKSVVSDANAFPSELGAYLSALAPLLPHRALAIDAGTGDGGLLDVLAPLYDRVVGIDRSEAQLLRAKDRATARGYANVELVHGELDGKEVRRAAGHGADAVFASRLLHHAPRPGDFVQRLADLARPGGALVVIDYARHDDESMRDQADVWLGFEPAELKRFARSAGLEDARVTNIPAPRCGRGPDQHLSWQMLVARKGDIEKNGTGKKGAKNHG